MWSEQNLSWKSRNFNGGMDKHNNKLTKFPILQKLTGGMIDFKKILRKMQKQLFLNNWSPVYFTYLFFGF